MKKSLAVNFTLGDIHRMTTIHPLRRWRIKAGKTLSDVGTAVGTEPSYISDIERFIKQPSLTVAAKLSKLSKVPIAKFVLETENAA